MKVLFGLACVTIAMIGCTTLPLATAPQQPNCANLDWFEIGRVDGSLGTQTARSKEYESRCEHTAHPFDSDLYTNGRNAGLVEYCTATSGFEAGRNNATYEKVCPDHLEKAFLENYELGARVRNLESENADLQSRIDNLVRLLAPNQPGSSVRAQIDQLRDARVQNETEIDTLESRAQTF